MYQSELICIILYQPLLICTELYYFVPTCINLYQPVQTTIIMYLSISICTKLYQQSRSSHVSFSGSSGPLTDSPRPSKGSSRPVRPSRGSSDPLQAHLCHLEALLFPLEVLLDCLETRGSPVPFRLYSGSFKGCYGLACNIFETVAQNIFPGCLSSVGFVNLKGSSKIFEKFQCLPPPASEPSFTSICTSNFVQLS